MMFNVCLVSVVGIPTITFLHGLKGGRSSTCGPSGTKAAGRPSRSCNCTACPVRPAAQSRPKFKVRLHQPMQNTQAGIPQG